MKPKTTIPSPPGYTLLQFIGGYKFADWECGHVEDGVLETAVIAWEVNASGEMTRFIPAAEANHGALEYPDGHIEDWEIGAEYASRAEWKAAYEPSKTERRNDLIERALARKMADGATLTEAVAEGISEGKRTLQ